MQTFLRKVNEYTTLEAIKFEREGRKHRTDRPDGASGLDVPEALSRQARVPRRAGGVRLLRDVGRVGGRPALEAPRAAPRRGRGGGDVTGVAPFSMRPRSPRGSTCSSAGSSRRSAAATCGWKRCGACLGPLRGRRVLDLGCGKGRFAAALARAGAEVIGLDRSAAMLAGAAAAGYDRVRGSARRLPLATAAFDAAIAVEVFEHLHRAAIDEVLRRAPPGAPARGNRGDRGQERGLVERPAALAAEPGGQVDRRAARALDVPRRRPGPRALVLAPRVCESAAGGSSATCA